MARIIGNLVAQDDYPHELGPEANFNESMYFNFFDPAQEIGGFVRLGNRANEGRAEMTVCLYLRDGRVLFSFKRPEIASNDAFDAGGLRFEVVEPAQTLRTLYRGSVIELDNPRELRDPRRAFAESPRRKISLDLLHDACGPMYGDSHSRQEADKAAENQFAKAHYEQHMRVTGSLDFGDEHLELEGYGLRDHSWGPRYWQAIERYEWLTMNFGPDLAAMVTVIQVAGEAPRQGGVIVRDGELIKITRARIDAEYEDNGLYHRTVHAKIETANGEQHEIEGKVKGFIPLRNRREGMTTHIGEGMTEWKLGEHKGYGLSEFLRQL